MVNIGSVALGRIGKDPLGQPKTLWEHRRISAEVSWHCLDQPSPGLLGKLSFLKCLAYEKPRAPDHVGH